MIIDITATPITKKSNTFFMSQIFHMLLDIDINFFKNSLF